MKKPLIRLSFGLFATAFFLFIAEVVARSVFPPVEFVKQMPYHPVVGHTMRPGLEVSCRDERGHYVYRINTLGFRGGEWTDRQPGVSRLLVVGDSFVQGWGLREEDTLQGRAALKLAEIQGTKWEGLGLAADDWGTAQEWLALREWGQWLDPDIVVLAFFDGNDVPNNAPGLRGLTRVSPSDPVRPYFVLNEAGQLRRFSHQPVVAALRRHSVMARTLESYLLGTLTPWGGAGEQEDPFARVKAGATPFRHWDGYMRELPLDWEEGWRISEALILRVRDEARRLGARFVLMHVPMCETVQYDPRTLCPERLFRVWHGVDIKVADRLDWNHSSRRLARLAAAEGIEFLDLLPILRRAVRRHGRQFYRVDNHLTPEASRLSGNALGELLAGRDPRVRLEEEAVQAPLLPEPGTAYRVDPDVAPDCMPGWGFTGWTREAGLSAGNGATTVMYRPGPGWKLRVEGFADKDQRFPFEFTAFVDARRQASITVQKAGAFRLIGAEPIAPLPGDHVVISFKVEPHVIFHLREVVYVE